MHTPARSPRSHTLTPTTHPPTRPRTLPCASSPHHKALGFVTLEGSDPALFTRPTTPDAPAARATTPANVSMYLISPRGVGSPSVFIHMQMQMQMRVCVWLVGMGVYAAQVCAQFTYAHAHMHMHTCTCACT